ncbi:MAG TPA: P-loop NTPase, partial [Candidatus Binataceae bacterium]|nr:P-loop NTPase [Candidatus Binataceae bacterium]
VAANTGIQVIGLVENMAGFNCDGCHAVRPLMPQGDLAAAAKETNAVTLARLPFDPRLAECCDRGTLFVREYAETPLAKQLKALSQRIEQALAIARPLPAAMI